MADSHIKTSSTTAEIAANLATVRKRMAEACHRYGRSPDDVRLIAVSKTKPIEFVQAAIEAGQFDFGENQIQDALTKITNIKTPNVSWHFIGPLQSNKTKHLPGNFQWWHTLSRIDIAKRVSRKAVESGVSVKALIQVNVIHDPDKSGVTVNDLPPLIEQVLAARLDGIKLRGLMTIGPHGGSENELRQCFATLRELLKNNRNRFALEGFDQLSMGMTNDMEQAIAEGATMVRVGSAIFGSR
jgi:pyridoxal phosphate enzyme (YggS family)